MKVTLGWISNVEAGTLNDGTKCRGRNNTLSPPPNLRGLGMLEH